jgi:thioredoxin 1
VVRRITYRSAAGAALLAGMVLVFAAAGCGASKFQHIGETAADFRQHVVQADEPVLVEFFKGGCPTCWMLDGTLDQLADEYKGRMKFVSFEMMRPYFAVTCPEIQKRHRIAYYPTIVLFIKGEEKQRWILDYGIDHYRQVLDEVAGGPVVQSQDVKKPDVKKPDAAELELKEFLGDL